MYGALLAMLVSQHHHILVFLDWSRFRTDQIIHRSISFQNPHFAP